MIHAQLIRKIKDHDAVVGVLGLGYVGLPLLLRFGEAGFRVVGFDVDCGKVAKLNAGRTYMGHIEATRVLKLRESGRFETTSDFSKLSQADCVLICVSTPLNNHREPDMQYVEHAVDAVAQSRYAGDSLLYWRARRIQEQRGKSFAGVSTDLGSMPGQIIFLPTHPNAKTPETEAFQGDRRNDRGLSESRQSLVWTSCRSTRTGVVDRYGRIGQVA